MRVLVTGAAGFIGYHTARALLDRGATVVGLDDLNPYYDPALKRARLAHLNGGEGFRFVEASVADVDAVTALFAAEPFTHVVHLAAQAGVRYSLAQPFDYVTANVTGHLAILEAARHHGGALTHLLYASSSSVYAGSTDLPYREDDRADRPLSLYGATKRAGELMSFAYAHLFGVPSTGLRFFTVYGPWGRPDMAYWLFAERIAEGRPIDVFNGGDLERDFTYVDDIVAGILGLLDAPPEAVGGEPAHRIVNLGHNQPVPLMDFIAAIEDAMGRKAEIRFKPMQPGDAYRTHANVDRAATLGGFAPSTPIDVGIPLFVDWFRRYNGYS